MEEQQNAQNSAHEDTLRSINEYGNNNESNNTDPEEQRIPLLTVDGNCASGSEPALDIESNLNHTNGKNYGATITEDKSCSEANC